ncbi:MAG: acyl carrier protein [Thermodesulfobacteriota bacterium]
MVLKEEVLRFIRENFIFDEAEKLHENDSLLEKGIIDSTGVLELVAFIEEKYKITVEDEELIPENLDSINRIAEFISRKLKALPN